MKAKLTLLFFCLSLMAISLSQVHMIRKNMDSLRLMTVAKRDIKNLLLLTLSYARKPEAVLHSEVIWKDLGIDNPIKDPWGIPYRMENDDKVVLWRSAGPDANYGTADDIFAKIPAPAKTGFIDPPNPAIGGAPDASSAQ